MLKLIFLQVFSTGKVLHFISMPTCVRVSFCEIFEKYFLSDAIPCFALGKQIPPPPLLSIIFDCAFCPQQLSEILRKQGRSESRSRVLKNAIKMAEFSVDHAPPVTKMLLAAVKIPVEPPNNWNQFQNTVAMLRLLIYFLAGSFILTAYFFQAQFLEAIKSSPASIIVCVICFFSIWSIIGLAGKFYVLKPCLCNVQILSFFSLFKCIL